MNPETNNASQIAELREEIIRLNMVLNQALLDQRTQPEQAKHEHLPKIAMPEKYKGPKDTTPIHTWVGQTKNYLNYFQCLYSPKGASIVQSLLKDEAATWHNHQVLVLAKEYSTGADLLDDLLLWARPKYNQQTLRDRLADLKQTSNVEEYITEFQNLSMLIEGLSKEEAFDRFQRGLFSQIRQEVLKLDTIDLVL